MEISMLLILIVQLICIVNGKVVIIPDTKLEDCNDSDAAKFFDFSELELIQEDDEHVFINGTWKILKEVREPWRAHVSTEKFDRGEWLVQALDRSYDDFCPSLHNAVEPWSYAFEGRENCPIPTGTNWFFDMMPIKFPESLLQTIPSHYMGRWRFVMIGEFPDENDELKKDCRRVYADIFED